MSNRKLYEQQLHQLNTSLIEMAQSAEKLINQTITVLKTGDDELAKLTIKQDDIVDLQQLEIEKQCALLIAHQQPIASDLRFIISVIKIITDIERIADQCSDICQYSLKLSNKALHENINYERHIERMAIAARDMLKHAIESFINKDTEAIKTICKLDDKIDQAFWKIWQEIIEEMKGDNQFIENGIQYIMIIKYLERIADHITNIAEWTYYSLTGKYIIHEQIKE